MANNTFASNFSADVSTYIANKVLSIAVKSMALYQVCDKVPMPKNSGRTFQYTRFERVALPVSELSEGTTPGDTSMSIATVSAVMDQWGAVIPITDVAIDSVKHPVLQKAIELAAKQAQETIDREIALVLLAGTNVFYPNAISARGSLTTSDKLDSSAIGKVVANLRKTGAMPFDSSNFIGIVDPYSEEDIIADSTFVAAAQYSQIKVLLNQEIGLWKGVRWIRSNTLPSLGLLASPSVATDGAAGGSLANATPYDVKVAVVDGNTGHETHLSAKIDVTTGAGDEAVAVTMPALPAGVPSSSYFRVYIGADGGTMYKVADNCAASAVTIVKTLPTSGDVAQAAAPSGVRVHHAFVLGKESIAAIELNKIKAYLTPATPSDSDPLVQRRKVGWKCDFKAVITNESFLARIEHYTSHGSNP